MAEIEMGIPARNAWIAESTTLISVSRC